MARRLKKMSDIRRALASIVNKTERDEIDLVKAGKLGYLLQILSRVAESSELESRITKIEKTLGDRK